MRGSTWVEVAGPPGKSQVTIGFWYPCKYWYGPPSRSKWINKTLSGPPPPHAHMMEFSYHIAEHENQ